MTIRALISNGVQVDCADTENRTPLLLASAKGNLEAVRELIRRGADIQRQDRDLRTALIYAAAEGHADVAEALLGRGAVVDARDRDGWTALMRAAHTGHHEVIRVLLRNGANPNAADNRGRTAVICAAFSGHADAIQALCLNHETSVSGVDNDGMSPLKFAARKGHVQAAKVLLDYMCGVSGSNGRLSEPSLNAHKRLALDEAIRNRSLGVVELLMAYGEQLDYCMTPAAKYPSLDPLVRTMLLSGAKEIASPGVSLALKTMTKAELVTSLRDFRPGWDDWLKQGDVAQPIIDEIGKHALSSGSLWQALAGANKTISERQKLLCCAGILAQLRTAETLKSCYSGKGLSCAGEDRFHAMIQAQVEFLASAGEEGERVVIEEALNKMLEWAPDMIMVRSGDELKALARDRLASGGLFDAAAQRVARGIGDAAVQALAMPFSTSRQEGEFTVAHALQELRERLKDFLSKNLSNLLAAAGKNQRSLNALEQGAELAGDRNAIYQQLVLRHWGIVDQAFAGLAEEKPPVMQ